MRGLYLAVDILTLAVPLFCSFYPKAPFRREWKWLFPAIAAVAILFVFWDVQFTKAGIWGFNPDYLIGYYWLGLPIEELLFFVCIPYSCMFIYFCSRYFIPGKQLKYSSRIVCGAGAALCLLIAVINLEKWYTVITFAGSSALLALFFFRKPYWLGHFLISYAVAFIPFLVVNGILTGTGPDEPVVWYNNDENLGLRILTIPVEDCFYALLLNGSIVSLYEFMRSSRF
ncbi:MAG: lycopene cyclase domain-containing protein [Bacteroidota bacterium]